VGANEVDTDLHSRTLFRIEKRLDDLDLRWERNNVLLEEHIKRTELLEKRVAPVEDEQRKTAIYVKIFTGILSGAGVLGVLAKLFWTKLGL
jgi:hypothetical protein